MASDWRDKTDDELTPTDFDHMWESGTPVEVTRPPDRRFRSWGVRFVDTAAGQSTVGAAPPSRKVSSFETQGSHARQPV